MADGSKLTITNFTDPMMGLSYESEPFLRKLETHFQGRIGFKYVMSGLVRDVYDFVDPADLRYGKEVALDRYNARLAKIYEAEEGITGMPINMANLRLFSTEHTSSIPLNLAYKAAQLADGGKADLLLYNLRYATIVECRPTTRFEEIMAVVVQTGISPDNFARHYEDGTAQSALNEDLVLRQTLGVTRLPAYLFDYAGRSLLVAGVLDYAGFTAAIHELTGGELSPLPPDVSLENVRDLIARHPLISPLEIREAFGLRDVSDVETLIQPLLAAEEICIKQVHRGWFIQQKLRTTDAAATERQMPIRIS